MSQISPEQAQQQLAAAQVLDCMTRQAARRNAYVGVITTAGVGIRLAAVLAISWAFAAHNLLAFWLSFAAYAISLTLLIVWQRRHQRVFQRGFGRTYQRSFAVSLVLYGFGVAWLIRHVNWMIITPYCMIVALPMLIAATRLARRSR